MPVRKSNHGTISRDPPPKNLKGFKSLADYLEFPSVAQLKTSLESDYFNDHMQELITNVLDPRVARKARGENVTHAPHLRTIISAIEDGERINRQKYSRFRPVKTKYNELDWYAYAVCGIKRRMESPGGWFDTHPTVTDDVKYRLIWAAIQLLRHERSPSRVKMKADRLEQAQNAQPGEAVAQEATVPEQPSPDNDQDEAEDLM